MTYTVSAGDVPPRLGVTDPVQSVLMNVAIILRTKAGSCPMYREFGLPQTHVGKPMPAARQLLYAAVRDAVERFEPRCDVEDVRFAAGADAGTLIPIVEVEIKA